MSSLVELIFGIYVYKHVENINRLLICAMGAIYVNNQNALNVYLKTLYYYCRGEAYDFARRTYGVRPATRGLIRSFDDLFRLNRSEDVISRFKDTLITHLAEFSHHTEIVLGGTTDYEVIVSFETVVRYTILTWKYVEFCMSSIVSDDSINILEDLSEAGIQQCYEYRFMHGFML
jgi:hypothetical protein